MIVEVERESITNGAISSKIYLDGAFFCYGIENDEYKIAPGSYNAYIMTSPKFGEKKVYIDVPGRSGIMFHGGNTKKDTKGCILTGKNGGAEFVAVDCSNDLYNAVNEAYKSGEVITVKITDTKNKKALTLIVAGVIALFFLLQRKKRK